MEPERKMISKARQLFFYLVLGPFPVNVFQGGCTTSENTPIEDSSDNLSTPLENPKDTSSLVVSPNSVVYWQSFFKPPPNVHEKAQLESQLSQWTTTTDPDVLLAKARAQVAVGHKKDAEATLLYLVRKNPDHLEGSLELANLFLQLESIPEALTTLANIQEIMGQDRKISPEFSLKYRYTLALCYIAQGDRQLGHSGLSEIIGDFPLFAPAYSALAQSYLDIDNDRLAEFVIQRAIDRIKNQPNLYNLAGAIALQQQQDSKAREFFDSALKINKNFAPALVNRAILSFRDLEYSAAEEDLIVAMKVDPINPDTLATYGILQMRLGNFDVAKNALTQALDIKPNHAISRFNLAVLYFDHLKKSDEARRLLTEVLNIKSASKRLKTQSEQYLSRLKTLQSAY